MARYKPLHCGSLIFFYFIVFISCNRNSNEIPFPENELGYAQPVKVPLQFSAEKKLTWDTVKRGGLQPTIKKLDIDQLPFVPYDTTGFKPFKVRPSEVHFDFNSLPSSSLDINKLPSIPLQFKTTRLPPPAVINTSPPVEQKDKPIAIYDFGIANGLPAKFITSLIRDRNGLMWIGSREGIFRFDGEHIYTFLPGPILPFIAGMAEDNKGRIWYIDAGGIGMIDPQRSLGNFSGRLTAVPENITKIFKDDKGLLWLYNFSDKAVSVIDPETLTFKNITVKQGLSDSSFFQAEQDNEKNIWLTSYNNGINILDLKSAKIKYLKAAEGLDNNSSSAITKDGSGQMWVATKGGVDAIDSKQGNIIHYNDPPGTNNYTLDLAVDNKGKIWKGTVLGLELLDIRNKTRRVINKDNGMSENIVLSCVQDNYNRMWFATVGGINVVDQNGETVRPVGNNNIISILEDSARNLWVATQKGIIIVNPERDGARTLDRAHGLSNDFVQSFYKFDDKVVVTTNGGINIIDPAKKTIEIINKSNGLANDTIYSSFKDRAGSLWFTGPNNGVDLIDSTKKFIIHTSVRGGLSDDGIADVKEDKEGLIWIATNKGGVDVIDMNKATIKYLDQEPGLKDTCNRLLLPDKNGRMWIGTDKGIYVADKKANTLTAITTKEGLSNDFILSLLEYHGDILAGTSNKVTIITPPGANDTSNGSAKWKISVLDRSQAFVKQGVSWAADAVTRSGQYLLGDNTVTVINDIKRANDSFATYITGIYIMTTPQHFVNTKSSGGIDSSFNATTSANAGFSDQKKFSWDSVEGAYNLPVNLTIPYKQNYVQFKFVQANLGRQDTTWYSYVLEGIDRKWSAPTTNTYTENYLNLPPGDYTFKVCSKRISGAWSSPASFSFVIAPPWYKTWWAYTIFALICIGILRAYIVYRSRKLTKENKVLEEKINLRTAQLQKSLEELQTTQTQLVQSEKMASLGELTAGIAHEIQNPLNFVNNFADINNELIEELRSKRAMSNSESGKLSNDDEQDALLNDIFQNNEKIASHGRRADAIVKNMLQHSRISSGQKEPTNINALADEYLRLAYHGMRAKDKSFNATLKTDFDDTIGNINIVSQDIGRVLLNLYNNAFYAVSKASDLAKGASSKSAIADPTSPKLAAQSSKLEATNAPYAPTVTVVTKKLNHKIEIRVRDNGPGIPQNIVDKIFQPFFTTKPTGEGTGLGLSLSYDIIKAHGGEIK
ncbi:MAG TPA: two-component regulator propeller domain-containing protein, partial [Parafilimonas sp.]|nr:two-component regulator propeller domain-containing protein [Parafilimonas sp.]